MQNQSNKTNVPYLVPFTKPDESFGFTPDIVSRLVRLTIYLPDCDDDGRSINVNFWIAATAQLLGHKLGGANVSEANKGYWYNSETLQMVEEKTYQMTVLADRALLSEHGESIDRHIRRFGSETGQGEVLVESDGRVLRHSEFVVSTKQNCANGKYLL